MKLIRLDRAGRNRLELEHAVDAVFELNRHPTVAALRVLRCYKNRYDALQDNPTILGPGVLRGRYAP
jgi:hypothetical protein